MKVRGFLKKIRSKFIHHVLNFNIRIRCINGINGYLYTHYSTSFLHDRQNLNQSHNSIYLSVLFRSRSNFLLFISIDSRSILLSLWTIFLLFKVPVSLDLFKMLTVVFPFFCIGWEFFIPLVFELVFDLIPRVLWDWVFF